MRRRFTMLAAAMWLAKASSAFAQGADGSGPELLAQGGPHITHKEAFWLDREGNPHTEQLHLIEKFIRVNTNFASTLLVGGGSQESVDRPSQIVP